MDFGFVFFGSVHIYPAVALAEKRGFTHAWLYDSQMLTSDVYAALALCAMHRAGINQVAIQAVTDPKETIETFSKEIIKRWT